MTLEMVRNPSQTILPEVAEQIAAVMADVAGARRPSAALQAEELERSP